MTTTKQADGYICFFDTNETGDEERDRAPIAIGKTPEEAIANGRERVLMLAAQGRFYGLKSVSVVVVKQPNLSADDLTHSLGHCVKQLSDSEALVASEKPAGNRRYWRMRVKYWKDQINGHKAK